jgi:hypothetical protein
MGECEHPSFKQSAVLGFICAKCFADPVDVANDLRAQLAIAVEALYGYESLPGELANTARNAIARIRGK